MQVSFENRFDHWLAFQIFYNERQSSLKRQTRKAYLKIMGYVIGFIVLINIITFDAETFEPGAALIPLAIFLGIFIWLLCRNPYPRKSLVSQYTAMHKAGFEKNTDQQTTWHVTDKAIVISQYNKQVQYKWDAIESITVCPQYLMVHFGFIEYAYLPAEAIDPAEYRPFCEHLVRTWQAYSIQAGNEAKIIHSDWAINMEVLKSQARPCSVGKIFFSVLWGIIFLLVYSIFCALIFFATAAVSVAVQERMSINTDKCGSVLAFIWFFGSVLMLLGGILLGLNEKLPGTRPRIKTPTPQHNYPSQQENPSC